MKFGYTIIYVKDVKTTLNFYNTAFDFKTKFIHDSGLYGELDTGETVLAFACRNSISDHVPNGVVWTEQRAKPLATEVAFITEDVSESHKKAISLGAIEISKPTIKDWGQTISYVQDPDGTLIELCTEVIK